MEEKIYCTDKGAIHYWVNKLKMGRETLIFLPGLTADHRLFGKQVAFFKDSYNVLVWDAPGHGKSRPFQLDFSLMDKAEFLHNIILREHIVNPILVGQSMGGYLAQCYMEKYPSSVGGFVSIDSAPLKRKYITAIELWMLKKVGIVYRMYPWKALMRDGARGCSTTKYGRRLMYKMMEDYEKMEYCALAAHGFKILAEAIEENRLYEIDSPCLLLCGEKDRAGSAKRYNKRWTKEEGLKLIWIKNAGHNSNGDNAYMVNSIIEDFIKEKNKME